MESLGKSLAIFSLELCSAELWEQIHKCEKNFEWFSKGTKRIKSLNDHMLITLTWILLKNELWRYIKQPLVSLKLFLFLQKLIKSYLQRDKREKELF